MSGLFGTDGVRGIPGRPPLAPALVRRLGRVAAEVLRDRIPGPARNGASPLVLMARDTRGSGPALVRQLAQGFAAAGCESIDAGVLPTPALSYLVPRRGALCGVVVSASHNPAEFNGIKFISSDGFKLAPEPEEEIEDRLGRARDPGAAVVHPRRDLGAARDYEEYLRSTFPAHLDLSGLRLVVDCANGAAWRIAPRLLEGLGAEVRAIGCRPDGRNINRGCGALETGAMRRQTARGSFDCGISFDGDADRAVFADPTGALCDGDVLLGMAAEDLQVRGLLPGGRVVVTVMSNYGLLRHLQSLGIEVVQVPVGDRNVTDAIERHGLSLGGENSGHVVFRRFSPTGDGLLTALQTLSIIVRTGRGLAAFRHAWRPCPQLLRNVRVDARIPLESLRGFQRRLRESGRRLRGRGRVFVRYSGTEPLLRVLVEGPERGLVHRISSDLIRAFKEEASQGGEHRWPSNSE